MKKGLIYARISREDEEKTSLNGHSNSIKNQVEMLVNYAKENEIEVLGTYVDDGVSGGDFERKGLLSLLNCCKNTKIDFVLIKDLSRLGRVAYKTAMLLEEIFPSFGAQVVAVSDGFNSDKDKDEISYAVKNFLNDYSLKDFKKRLKSIKDYQANNVHLNFYPKFGYRFDENKKEEIDGVSASVVKLIFTLACEGKNCIQIAENLNKKGILTRSAYAKEVLKLKPLKKTPSKKWSQNAVREILQDIEYLGHSVNLSSKSKEKRIILKNTHLAIITQREFENAQKVIKSKPRKNETVLLIDGKSGKRLLFENNGKYSNFYLRQNGKRVYSIKKEEINFALRENLKRVISVVINEKNLLLDAVLEKKKLKINAILKLKKEVEKEEIKLTEYYLDRKILENEYSNLCKKLNAKSKELQLALSKINGKTEVEKVFISDTEIDKIIDCISGKILKITVGKNCRLKRFVIKAVYSV